MKFGEETVNLLASESLAEVGEDSELVDALETCVEKLPAGQRDLLKRRYEPDATSRRVAQTLGRSESSISRALNKIYRQLMTCIETATGTATDSGAPRD